MKFSILFLLLLFCINLPSQAQNKTEKTNTTFASAKQSIINSEKRYEEVKKVVFRAREKLKYYKKSKTLNYNELQKKENTLKQAEQKLKKMAQLIEHNKVLLQQLKTNPSLGKSIKSTEAQKKASTKNIKTKSKSQPKTLNDRVFEERQKKKNKTKEDFKKMIKEKQKNNN